MGAKKYFLKGNSASTMLFFKYQKSIYKKMKEKPQDTFTEIVFKNWNELSEYEISHTPDQLRSYANGLLNMGHLNKRYGGLSGLLDREQVAHILKAKAESNEELGIFLGLDNPTWKLIVEKYPNEAANFQMHKGADNFTENFEWKSFAEKAVEILHIPPPNLSNARNALDKLDKYRAWWMNQLEAMPLSKINDILKKGRIGERLTSYGELYLGELQSDKTLEKMIANIR